MAIAKSAYAYFFVNKLLKYGTKQQRKAIFSQTFEGKVNAMKFIYIYIVFVLKLIGKYLRVFVSNNAEVSLIYCKT